MDLKAAIIAELDDTAVRSLADRCLGAVTAPAEARARLQSSRRVTLADTLTLLRKDALVTICRVLGLEASGRRADLEERLLKFGARSRRASSKNSVPRRR